MDSKKLLVGTVNGTVGMMAVAYLMWGVLLRDFFSARMSIEALDPPILLLQVLSCACGALLLTIVLSWKNPSGVSEAVKDAALVGVLMWLGVNFWNMGSYVMWDSMQAALTDAVLTAIPFGAAGGAIYWTTMRGELQSGRIVQGGDEPGSY
jgi:hypothetical protein